MTTPVESCDIATLKPYPGNARTHSKKQLRQIAESIKRFRSRYRETFGATATGDPLYQAVSDGRRLAGMEHWLPLFEERLVPLAEHLGKDTLIVRDSGVTGAIQQRFEAITDYHANRVAAQASTAGSTPSTGRISPVRASSPKNS